MYTVIEQDLHVVLSDLCILFQWSLYTASYFLRIYIFEGTSSQNESCLVRIFHGMNLNICTLFKKTPAILKQCCRFATM